MKINKLATEGERFPLRFNWVWMNWDELKWIWNDVMQIYIFAWLLRKLPHCLWGFLYLIKTHQLASTFVKIHQLQLKNGGQHKKMAVDEVGLQSTEMPSFVWLCYPHYPLWHHTFKQERWVLEFICMFYLFIYFYLFICLLLVKYF